MALRKHVEWGFFIPAFACFLVMIIDEIRLVAIPAYMYDEEYFSTIQLRNGMAVDVFLLAILALIFGIPAGVLYFEDKFVREAVESQPISRQRRSILKIVFLESALLLEISFAVTSQALSMDNIHSYVIYQLLPKISFGGIKSYSFQDWDYYCLVLSAICAFCIFFIFAKKYKYKISLLQTLQVVTLLLLPLEIEILVFDRSEFFIRVMQTQSDWSSGWFTNADLFSLLIGILAITTLLSLRIHFHLRTIVRSAGMSRPSRFRRQAQSEQD
jgi:hypothetical protein